MSLLRELVRPTPVGSLAGDWVEAVSSIPLDEPPEYEGDDAVHGEASKGGKPGTTISHRPVGAMRAGPPTKTPVRVVPFVRVLGPGTAGPDVVSVQRALRAEGDRKMPPSGWYGPIMVRNVKAFQAKQHITPVSGKYGKGTHHALGPFFDAYGAFLMFSAFKQEEVHKERLAIVATALFGYAHRDMISYTQGGHRLDAVRDHLVPPRFPTNTDCSGFATWCYEVAGAPDPSGSKYDPAQEHYTGSMARNGRKIGHPSLGDLCIYGGAWPYHHVTIYIGNGMCVSHGSDAGPYVLPVNYRDDLAEYRTYF